MSSNEHTDPKLEVNNGSTATAMFTETADIRRVGSAGNRTYCYDKTKYLMIFWNDYSDLVLGECIGCAGSTNTVAPNRVTDSPEKCTPRRPQHRMHCYANSSLEIHTYRCTNILMNTVQ